MLPPEFDRGELRYTSKTPALEVLLQQPPQILGVAHVIASTLIEESTGSWSASMDTSAAGETI